MKGFLSGVVYRICCLFLYIASFLIFEEDVHVHRIKPAWAVGCGILLWP